MLTPNTLPNGTRTWMDSDVLHVIDALTSYDPQLALVKTSTGAWEIWRVAEDGSEHRVMRSQPGARLGVEVVALLAERDTRRHGDKVVDGVIAANLKTEKDRADKYEEGINEAMDRMMSKAWKGRINSVMEDTF